MNTGSSRLSTHMLNTLFVNSLDSAVDSVGDLTVKPLLLKLKKPYPVKLRVYLYNCTNPPGGRSSDEYKSQLIVPGQARGCRGNFDFSDDHIVLLAAYACFSSQIDEGVFVLWDAMHHTDFSYSANIQIKTAILFDALCKPVGEGVRENNEVVLTAQPSHLIEAIIRRIEILHPFSRN